MPAPEAIAALAAEVRRTTAYEFLTEYVRQRIAQLQADDVTDPYVAMKRRGQVEELQRLLGPQPWNLVALADLQRREASAAEATAPEAEGRVPRDWWVAPGEEPVT